MSSLVTDRIDAAPDFVQGSAIEVVCALAIASQAFRDLGIPVTAEDVLPVAELILNRADADLALYAEDDGETEEDDA